MVKKTTLESLEKIVKKGFSENARRFNENTKILNEHSLLLGETTKQLNSLSGSINTNAALIKLTRFEMAKDADFQEMRSTVDSIWTMLDDEARFIQQMRAEYPLLIKRLERIEKKLGLPHRIT